MKKNYFPFLAAVLLCLFLLVPAGIGRAEESGLTIAGGVVTDYSGTADTVVIPDGVTAIDDGAFRWNSTLREVTLPASLRSIGSGAFYHCTSLSSINLPEGLVSIGSDAFYGCTSLTALTVPASVTEIDQYAFDWHYTHLTCYARSAAVEYLDTWYSSNSAGYRIIGAKDISALTVRLEKTSYSYREGAYFRPAVTVLDGSQKLDSSLYNVSYSKNDAPGVASVLITMEIGDGSYSGSRTVTFTILPADVTYLVSGLKTSASAVSLKWNAAAGADSYEVERWDESTNSWMRIASTAGTSWTDKNRKADTRYRYRVRACLTTGDVPLQGGYSNTLTVSTLPSSQTLKNTEKAVKSGSSASVTAKATATSTVLDTQDLGWTNWSHVSEISQFQDEKGNYCYAYMAGKNIVINKYNSKLKKVATVKFKRRYPLLGGVACDADGNYYVVWGKRDASGKGGKVTMAVSKYTAGGKHVKTVTYKTSKSSDSWETKTPFDAGNCAIAIKGDLLVCSYGRLMYNGHQSNDILAVNIRTMTKLTDYSNYASHSFNQSVLISSTDDVIYTNHGDAYPRGIVTSKDSTNASGDTTDGASNTSFGFYGNSGNNYTGAQLGGTAETSAGYMLAAAGPKSMTKKSENQNRNVFVQLLDKSDLSSLLSASTRKGTVNGTATTNTGIKWLTNYSSKYTASAVSIVATDDDRVIVFWEKRSASTSYFINSYYMVLSASGTTLQKATPLYRRLNVYESPVYRDGCVYWTTAPGSGKKATTYKMDVTKLVKDTSVGKIKGLKYSRTVRWGYTYTTLSWDAVEPADGYIVYRSASKNGTYTNLGRSGSASLNSFTDYYSGSQVYYYKVRAYRKVGSRTCYGAFAYCRAA